MIKNTGLAGLEYAYYKAEEITGINALFIAAITATESGWGTHDRAKYQNNLSGYGVHKDTSRGKTFTSKEQSIIETAKLIKKYYDKGNKDIWSISKIYCPPKSDDWSKLTNYIVVNDLLGKIK